MQGKEGPPVFDLRPQAGAEVRHVARATRQSLKKEVAFQKKVSFWKPVQRDVDDGGLHVEELALLKYFESGNLSVNKVVIRRMSG